MVLFTTETDFNNNIANTDNFKSFKYKAKYYEKQKLMLIMLLTEFKKMKQVLCH